MPPARDRPPPEVLYKAYLLRLWRDGPDAPWRASLEPPGGDAPHRFGTVEALLAFLRERHAAPPPAGDARGRERNDTPAEREEE